MAASGYTPILIYASGTATNVPLAANLTSSASGAELALNYADGKLFYKDSGGVVQVLASKAGNVNVASFQTSLGGLTPSTATTGVVTLAGTLNTSSGGTGLSSYTAGDLSYYASGTALSKLAIGTSGQILTSSGTAPQWSTLSGVAVTTFSAGTTGFTPNSATSGAITLAGTLATTNGGTGLTSFTANGVVYASSTSALATGSALTFDGTNGGTTGIWSVGNLASVSGGYVRVNRSDNATYNEIKYTTGDIFYFNQANGGAYQFNISGTEQMRLTSTGLGIGTSSPGTKLTVVGPVTVNGPALAANQTAGLVFDYQSTIQGARFFSYGAGSVGQFVWYQGSGGNNPTQAMTLDASGRLVVGATSTAAKFQVSGASANTYLLIDNAAAGENYYAANAAHIFQTAGTERARIDSSGNLLVGRTSQIASGRFCVQNTVGSNTIETIQNGSGGYNYYSNAANNGGSFYHASFTEAGTQKGSIVSNGSVTLYNTTSDQRLKENIVDAESSSALIDAIQVRQYNWKSDGSHQRYGFVAQELVTVAPEAVHQPADPEEMMAVDYSKLVPMLVKEIQDLRKRLAALEAK